MTDVSAAILAYLLSKSAITDLVGQRVYSMRAPASATNPKIVIQRVSGNRIHHLKGSSGLVKPFYQINCWSATSVGANNLGEAVRDVLDGFRGTVANVEIHSALQIDDREFDEPSAGLDQNAAFQRQLDYEVFHRESLPTGIP